MLKHVANFYGAALVLGLGMGWCDRAAGAELATGEPTSVERALPAVLDSISERMEDIEARSTALERERRESEDRIRSTLERLQAIRGQLDNLPSSKDAPTGDVADAESKAVEDIHVILAAWRAEKKQLDAQMTTWTERIQAADREREHLLMEVTEVRDILARLASEVERAPGQMDQPDPSLDEPAGESSTSGGWFSWLRRSGEDAADSEEGDAASTIQITREPVVQKGDQVEIRVFREPDFSGVFLVMGDGGIRHPLLGSVPVEGLTAEEAERHLTELLDTKFLVNPRVMLDVTKAAGIHITLLGEVRNPGVYPLDPGETISLLQAVAKAGGFTDLASTDRIRILRTVGDEPTTLRVRVSDILGGRGQVPDPPLEPNDVVMVPEVLF